MATKEQGGGAEQQHEIRQNAEEFPYVWASFIVAYGGIALWTGYRWRRLQKIEDRVRALQGRLRSLAEAEDAAASIAKSPAKNLEK